MSKAEVFLIGGIYCSMFVAWAAMKFFEYKALFAQQPEGSTDG